MIVVPISHVVPSPRVLYEFRVPSKDYRVDVTANCRIPFTNDARHDEFTDIIIQE